jgi:hypothetical protein
VRSVRVHTPALPRSHALERQHCCS